eukprot:767571-Hanusia_phi.AAC.2
MAHTQTDRDMSEFRSRRHAGGKTEKSDPALEVGVLAWYGTVIHYRGVGGNDLQNTGARGRLGQSSVKIMVGSFDHQHHSVRVGSLVFESGVGVAEAAEQLELVANQRDLNGGGGGGGRGPTRPRAINFLRRAQSVYCRGGGVNSGGWGGRSAAESRFYPVLKALTCIRNKAFYA